MEIGKRIQRLRQEKGLTQEQAAAALGITGAAVSKWETNAALPDVALLCPLARLLGTTVDGLLDYRPVLTEEEINGLLEERRKLFEAKRLAEAAASCEALLREYPDSLPLKCATAGLYIMYLPAWGDPAETERQMDRVAALLEDSRRSGDPALAANARSMLVNLYIMREELDRALTLLDEEPERRLDVRITRANILLRKGELDEAEKLYQTGLWMAARDVSLNLMGMYNGALRREDWARALECVDRALAVEDSLLFREAGGLSASLRFLRAKALLRQERMEEAMESLTAYVDQSLEQWGRLKGEGPLPGGFFHKLNWRSSGMSAAYLAKYVRAALEEDEELAPLRERLDFQALLARLTEAGAAE